MNYLWYFMIIVFIIKIILKIKLVYNKINYLKFIDDSYYNFIIFDSEIKKLFKCLMMIHFIIFVGLS
jgi:hypothetical protein